MNIIVNRNGRYFNIDIINPVADILICRFLSSLAVAKILSP